MADAREEVIITQDDESSQETAYLLQSPENARRLRASITRLEQGEGTARGSSTAAAAPTG